VNPKGLLSERLMDDAIPLVFVVLMMAVVVLPAVTFGIARKWGTHQPEVASGALAGAVIVSVVGILATAFLALVVLGWVPPLEQLIH
jgi:exosortase/archaeosortase